MVRAGLEPGISGSQDKRPNHWATLPPTLLPNNSSVIDWLIGFDGNTKSSNDLQIFASTCIEWLNDMKVGWSVQNLNMIKANASHQKSAQGIASGWANRMQVSASSKSCAEL